MPTCACVTHEFHNIALGFWFRRHTGNNERCACRNFVCMCKLAINASALTLFPEPTNYFSFLLIGQWCFAGIALRLSFGFSLRFSFGIGTFTFCFWVRLAVAFGFAFAFTFTLTFVALTARGLIALLGFVSASGFVATSATFASITFGFVIRSISRGTTYLGMS